MKKPVVKRGNTTVKEPITSSKVGIILDTLIIILFMWLIVSFIDVNLHNFQLDGAAEMWKYNFFVLITS